MKVIDLLNKIVNEEPIPEYIRYRDISKHEYNIMLVCKENIIYQIDQCALDLNDEVEIIEEEREDLVLTGKYKGKEIYEFEMPTNIFYVSSTNDGRMYIQLTGELKNKGE